MGFTPSHHTPNMGVLGGVVKVCDRKVGRQVAASVSAGIGGVPKRNLRTTFVVNRHHKRLSALAQSVGSDTIGCL